MLALEIKMNIRILLHWQATYLKNEKKKKYKKIHAAQTRKQDFSKLVEKKKMPGLDGIDIEKAE